MADILGDNYTEIAHAGTYGNKASFEAVATLASAASGDEVQLCKLPAGTRITDIHVINAAFGSGVTLNVGWEYPSGTSGGATDALLASGDVAAAGGLRGDFAPVDLAETAVVTATIGGGTATGQLNVNIETVFKGNL